ncbi:preprotein translocase, SecG subunit [Proteus penneri ATCC 35198]|nr:preprotein translocase, SecG subunit [Proteus penneri ATCC 35198]
MKQSKVIVKSISSIEKVTQMYTALIVILIIVATGLVGLILLQQGKGADMGASFGAGASGTVFGSSGSANFMTRMTAVLATAFIVLALILGNLSANKTVREDSKWMSIEQTTEEAKKAEQLAAPVAPANTDIPQ